jgi:hypothetical protein
LIDAVKKAIGDKEVSKIVVASRGGKSAVKLAEKLGKGVQVISVSEFSYSDDTKKKMKKLKMVPVENADLVVQDMKETRETMLEYGPNVKAAVEVAVIAKQKGLVEEDYVAVSGNQTALLVNPDTLESDLMSEPADAEKIKLFIDSMLVA